MKRSTLALVVLPFLAASALVPVLWTGARDRREPGAQTEGRSAPVPAVELVAVPPPPDSSAQREERVTVAHVEAVPRLETFETLQRVKPPAALLKSSQLVFRLLDPGRRPLAGQRELGARFEMSSSDGRASMSEGRIVSDPDGTAPLFLGEFHGADATWTMTVYVRDTELVGRVEGARPLQPGINDLGDVVTRYAAVLVEGRVVDARGAPVESATVRIVAAGSFFPWRLLETETDGSFVLFDDPPSGELVLVAEKEGHLPAPPLPFRAGARGLFLGLADGAAIAGSIVVVEGLRTSDVALALRCRAMNWRKTVHMSTDGSFRFEGLAPGTYDIEVRCNDALLEVGDLAVAGIETLHDPRLRRIDLRAVARAKEPVPKVRARRMR